MEKYRRVAKPTGADATKPDEEIRVTHVGSVSAYVARAATVFNELNKSYVLITGTGNACAKAVQLAEVVKRRFKGLHQTASVGTTEIVDEYEPLEEGLDKVKDTRTVSHVEIKLSKEPLDTSDKGYQAPLPESEVKDFDPEVAKRARGRGRGKSKGRGKGGKEKSKSPKGGSASKGKGSGKGKGGKAASPAKGKGKGKSASPAKGKGKGKAAASPDKGKSKGKGKGKADADKGKAKGKGKAAASPPKGKGKSKGKSAPADKGKGKGKASPPKGKSKGKGKSKK